MLKNEIAGLQKCPVVLTCDLKPVIYFLNGTSKRWRKIIFKHNAEKMQQTQLVENLQELSMRS